jgi:hypothetical protein
MSLGHTKEQTCTTTLPSHPQGDVDICKVHTDQNIANPLTKHLPQPKYEAHMRSMCIRYLHE